jgi:hypothetical protein
MKWRWVRVFGVSAALAALVGGSPAQASPGCLTDLEQDARAVRDFQTMLMVSALQCARQSPQTLASYNQFVSRTRPILASAGDTLRKGFVRTHGSKDGQRAYDRQVTAVANEQSFVQRAANWCEQASGLALEASARDQSGLVALARESLGRSSGDSCSLN